MIIGDGSYCFTLEKRGYVKVSGKSLNTYDSILLIPPGRELHTRVISGASPGSRAASCGICSAGADITGTFTYYSRDVGTPDGCDLTVRICFGITEGLSYRQKSFSVFRNKPGVL